jgi:hypothetical protein
MLSDKRWLFSSPRKIFLNYRITTNHDTFIILHIIFQQLTFVVVIVATLHWPSVGVNPNTTLAKCGGESQHLEKVRTWSPPGLLNV